MYNNNKSWQDMVQDKIPLPNFMFEFKLVHFIIMSLREPLALGIPMFPLGEPPLQVSHSLYYVIFFKLPPWFALLKI